MTGLLRAALVWLALAPMHAHAGEVIAHSSVHIDAEEIRDVYLGEKQFAGGVKLVPVDNAAIQSEFLAKILQTDAAKYSARWTRKSFRDGLTPPSMKGSDAEVMAFVRATPGAIGYITGTTKGGMKVLVKF